MSLKTRLDRLEQRRGDHSRPELVIFDRTPDAAPGDLQAAAARAAELEAAGRAFRAVELIEDTKP